MDQVGSRRVGQVGAAQHSLRNDTEPTRDHTETVTTTVTSADILPRSVHATDSRDHIGSPSPVAIAVISTRAAGTTFITPLVGVSPMSFASSHLSTFVTQLIPNH